MNKYIRLLYMPVSIGKSGSSKISSKNSFSTRDMGTVDSNHTEKMIHFQERKKDLPKLKEKLVILQEKYNTLKKAGIIPPDLIDNKKGGIGNAKNKMIDNDDIDDNNSGDNNSEWVNDLISETDRSDFDINDVNGGGTDTVVATSGKIEEQLADFNYLNIINSIEKEIKQITHDIAAIENNGEEYKYILNTGTLLFQYYDNVSNPTAIATTTNSNRATTSTYKSVWGASFNSKSFGINATGDDSKEKGFDKDNDSGNGPTTPASTSASAKQPRKLRSMIRSNLDGGMNGGNKMSRSEMLDEFKSLTDSNWVKKTESKDKHEESICIECKIPKVLQYKESKYICPKCGVEEITQIDSDRPSFKDPPPDANYFAYKRINHFNELLAQFQAKESTHIPKEVFDAIKKELKKERKQIKDLDFELVKNYLKKYNDLHYTQYYDHIYHIINRLNGDKPLNMTPEMENNLRILFQKIQAPFNKYCPTDRKNFISYNFVFYKFCKLLGYNEFLHYFPLLKSKDKLYEQEKIWQKVMTDIGLPYK